MVWPLQFLLCLVGFSVAAMVIRYLTMMSVRRTSDGGAIHVWGDDVVRSLKVGGVPALFVALFTNL